MDLNNAENLRTLRLSKTFLVMEAIDLLDYPVSLRFNQVNVKSLGEMLTKSIAEESYLYQLQSQMKTIETIFYSLLATIFMMKNIALSIHKNHMDI